MLAQMGFRPIILERGKVVRERTKDTWGLWRQGVLEPGIERAVRRRRRRHLLRRQAVQPDQGPAASRPQGAGRNSSRPARRRKSSTSAKPHIGTFRLVSMVEKMRATHRRAGRRDPLRQPRSTDIEIDRQQRQRQVRGVRAGRRRAHRRRSRRAGGRPQRARHLPDAARARRVHRSQAVLDRLPHRASAVADRPRPLRHERRPSAARRRRLQAGASLQPTAARSTASACARAARWSPPPRNRAAWSPTA